jgi:hypothetical protein
MKKNILAFFVIGVIMVLIILNYKDAIIYYEEYRHEKVMTEYANIPCESVNTKFESDLKSGTLKIFVGGDYLNPSVAQKIGVEIFSNGSHDNIIGVGTNRECYNNLVEEYFLKNKGFDLRDSISIKWNN